MYNLLFYFDLHNTFIYVTQYRKRVSANVEKKLLSYYYHFEPSSEESEIRQVVAEVPGSSFFDSDSGSETVHSWNSVPITIPRLSMARTRFPNPIPRLHRL